MFPREAVGDLVGETYPVISWLFFALNVAPMTPFIQHRYRCTRLGLSFGCHIWILSTWLGFFIHKASLTPHDPESLSVLSFFLPSMALLSSLAASLAGSICETASFGLFLPVCIRSIAVLLRRRSAQKGSTGMNTTMLTVTVIQLLLITSVCTFFSLLPPTASSILMIGIIAFAFEFDQAILRICGAIKCTQWTADGSRKLSRSKERGSRFVISSHINVGRFSFGLCYWYSSKPVALILFQTYRLYIVWGGNRLICFIPFISIIGGLGMLCIMSSASILLVDYMILSVHLHVGNHFIKDVSWPRHFRISPHALGCRSVRIHIGVRQHCLPWTLHHLWTLKQD